MSELECLVAQIKRLGEKLNEAERLLSLAVFELRPEASAVENQVRRFLDEQRRERMSYMEGW